jgi:hypothetical protein
MRKVLAGVAAAAMAAMGSVTAASAAPAPAGLRQIHYRGYQFEVPAAWPVIDLAANPHACVRFDRHAVYLGTPGADERCPARGAGRTTEAVLVQPGSSSAAAAAVRDPVTNVVTVTAPRIKMTATYATGQAQILRIVASASLPAPVTRVPRPGAAPPAAPHSAPRPSAAPPAVRRAAARPAAATADVGPGAFSYTGQGFDACEAPSESVMSAWKSGSPYRAVGIYIGGSESACAQPNLTAGWISDEAANGWHYIPLWVGPQAEYGQLTSPASQAVSNAEAAVAQAQALGFGPGTPLYYDMEGGYSSSDTSAVLTFLSDWTSELHALGYRSGVYSSSSAAVTDLAGNYTSYTMPDVIYDALWNGQANTGDPVIPSGDWANHQRIHQYTGGVTQTYGGDTLDIDQDYLDVSLSSAAANLAGGPIISDPASGNFEVYGTGTGGSLQEIAWRPGGAGWTSWINLGGSITGTPSAVYNPASGDLEVYAQGTTGALMEKYWSPSTKSWSAWVNLGGSITGSPAAIYDQASGNLEVYATGTDGSLQEIAWRPGGAGWTSWINLGGSITGDPSPVNDPATGDIEVYARGVNGPLYQKYWSPTTKSWSAWVDLGGSITGSPAAMFDPATGNLEVYATDPDATVGQIAYIPGTGWSKWRSLGGAIAGTPSPVYDPADGPVNVFGTQANGPLFTTSWTPATSWSPWLNLYLGGALTGSPAASYDLDSGNLEAYAVTSTGTLFQAAHTSSGWQNVNLGGSLAGL